jgi:hypothetical protein
VCIAVIFIVIVLVVQLIDCIIQWVDKGKCEPTVLDAIFGSDDPPPVVSEDFLTAAPNPPASHTAAHYIQELYNAHMTLWQAFDQALSFLTVTGLVYPDQYFLKAKLYTQFTAIPATTGWPQKPEPTPDTTYHFYPSAGIEQPQEQASPYPAGVNPFGFITGVIGAGFPAAWVFALRLWLQIVRGGLDTENLDLDADRGQGHRCWQVAPGTSINDNPLSVITLAYGDL